MAETPLSPESAAGETTSGETPFQISGEGPYPASAGRTADPGAPDGAGPDGADPDGTDPDGADNAETSSGGESPPAATAISPEDSAVTSTAGTSPGAAPWIATAASGSEDSPAEPVSPSFHPFAAPSPEPAPAVGGSEPEPATAAEPAGIATTIAVPPLETAARAEGDGGEWELLVAKLNAWFNSGELAHQWQKIQGPLKGVAILVGVILALRLYATVVGTLNDIPLLSGLLELTGLIVFVRFSLTKLVKTRERQQVLATWNRRWQAFIGQD